MALCLPPFRATSRNGAVRSSVRLSIPFGPLKYITEAHCNFKTGENVSSRACNLQPHFWAERSRSCGRLKFRIDAANLLMIGLKYDSQYAANSGAIWRMNMKIWLVDEPWPERLVKAVGYHTARAVYRAGHTAVDLPVLFPCTYLTQGCRPICQILRAGSPFPCVVFTPVTRLSSV